MSFKSTFQALKFVKNYRSFKNAADDISKERAYSFLKDMFGENLGLFTKFLQYQGMSADSNFDFLLGHQETLDGVEYNEILELLKKEFGDKFQHFSDFSVEAQKASVGQVHSAFLVDEKVAIKVQYPGIRKVFEEQFKLFNLLPRTGLAKKWNVEFQEYQQMFQKLLEKELDYRYEAEQLKKWKHFLKNDSTFYVPEVFSSYSGERILVTEYIEGELIDQIPNADLLKHWSKEIWRSYFELLFNYNVIQGDSNHGNYIFQRSTGKIYYLDMAQSVYLSPAMISTIKSYFQLRLKGETAPAYDVFCKVGFDSEKMKQISPKLELILELLTEPFFSDYEYDLRAWDYKKRLDYILGEDKWWFRSAGPTEFFLLMKSFTGMKNLSHKISTKIFIKPILQNILKDSPVPQWEIQYQLDGIHSKRCELLRVILWRDGVEKVRLKVPFNAIFDLEQFLAADTVKAIKERGYDFQEIVKSAVADGGLPKNLIEFSDDHLKVKIDLI